MLVGGFVDYCLHYFYFLEIITASYYIKNLPKKYFSPTLKNKENWSVSCDYREYLDIIGLNFYRSVFTAL